MRQGVWGCLKTSSGSRVKPLMMTHMVNLPEPHGVYRNSNEVKYMNFTQILRKFKDFMI